MKAPWLRDYEMREREIAHAFAPEAVLGEVVVRGELIYQDLFRRKRPRLGFHRSGAPLPTLLYLYEQTVVFVPPASTEQIESRLGIGWGQLLELAASRVIIPIVGHPVEYAGRHNSHFEALFETQPASVWARGDELSIEFANGREHWARAHFEFERHDLTKYKWIVEKFRRQYPRVGRKELAQLIDIELKTNYVDLCIYGWEPLATSLLAEQGTDWGIRRLLELSESLTYPTLIGLGGTPAYGLRSDLAIQSALDPKGGGAGYVLPSAPLLLDGLSLTTPTALSSERLTEFHADGLSKQLWKAVQAVEDEVSLVTPDAESLQNRAELASRAVRRVLAEVSSHPYKLNRSKLGKASRDVADMTLKVGILPVVTATLFGPLGNDWLKAGLTAAELSAYLLGLSKSETIIKRIDEVVEGHLAKKLGTRAAAHMWWLSDWASRRALP